MKISFFLIYFKIINWISSIIRDIPRDLVAKSFDVCGITQNNQINYHSALRHLLTTNEIPITMLDKLDGSEDLDEIFFDDPGDENEESDVVNQMIIYYL